MAPLCRTRWTSSLLAVFVLASSLVAAPAPEPGAAAPVEKYFPDDANAALVINVKGILSSPLYAKNFSKQVEGLLALDQAKPFLKDCGFDPLKDIDMAAVVMSPSAQQVNAPGPVGPFLVVQGRFDPVKFQAKADQFAKDGLVGVPVKASKAGDANLYEITMPHGQPVFACLLDKTALVVAPTKELVLEALDKSSGKKTTKLKNASLKKMLDNMDPKSAVSAVALGELVMGGSVSTTVRCGVPMTVSHTMTLANEGIEAVQAGFSAGDEIKGKVTFTAKDADKAKALGKTMEVGLEGAIADVTKQNSDEFKKLGEVLKTIKVNTKDDTIVMEGHGGADALQALVATWFLRSFAVESKPVPRSPCSN
jgi:hypothetical protein